MYIFKKYSKNFTYQVFNFGNKYAQIGYRFSRVNEQEFKLWIYFFLNIYFFNIKKGLAIYLV